MEAKLKECLGTFSTFQTDLSALIGIDGDSGNPGASQSGAEGGSSDTITGAVQEGGSLIDNSLNGEEGWTASFNTAKDSIHESAISIVECIESMASAVTDLKYK